MFSVKYNFIIHMGAKLQWGLKVISHVTYVYTRVLECTRTSKTLKVLILTKFVYL